MPMHQIKCPICGNAENLRNVGTEYDSRWECSCCGALFVERLAKREYEKLEHTITAGLESIGSSLSDALLNNQINERAKKYYDLRARMWEKITANYINNKVLLAIAQDIRAIAPDDFLAEFIDVATREPVAVVAEYIKHIDERENESSMTLVLEFIIKSLKEEYITATAALLERCSRFLTPEKKQYYFTWFEEEAEKVKEGIYEVALDRDVFLAYSSKDMPAVIDLLNYIESNGMTCFAAFRNLQHGNNAVANYDSALKTAIDHCSIFLFVSSENSRSFSCDALKKELEYIRKTEMDRHPGYASYILIPKEYKKLRIEYRLDNKPTPLPDRNIKSFFDGLTYVEDYNQLFDRLGECIDKLCGNYVEKNDDEREVKAKAEAEAKAKAEAEAKAKAEAEAKAKAEAEAKAKAEAEAKVKVEAEAKKRAEAEAKHKEENESAFVINNGVLEKYTGTQSVVEIPYGVKAIGSRAFKDNKSVVRVVIPDTVSEIRLSAFYECSNLTDVNIPHGVKSIGICAFGHTKISGIILPDSITDIGKEAFASCTQLASVLIPASIKRIGEGAFCDCTSLENLNISDGVCEIGKNAFSRCSNIESVTLPDSINKIDDRAFYGCCNLTTFTMSNSVATIGSEAFYECRKFENLTILNSSKTPAEKVEVHYSTFFWCDNLTIYVARGVNLCGAFDKWNCGCSVYELETNKCLVEGDNIAEKKRKAEAKRKADKAKAKAEAKKKAVAEAEAKAKAEAEEKQSKINLINSNVKFTANQAIELDAGISVVNGVLQKYTGTKTRVYIPYGTTKIGEGAFAGCSFIEEIVIPNTVRKVDAWFSDFNAPFYGCTSLKKISLGGIDTIEKGMFKNLPLEELIIPDGVKKIDVGFSGYDTPFYGCYALKKIVIGKGITEIAEGLFSNLPIEEITIPESVTVIRKKAFANCTSLKRVTIPKSVIKMDVGTSTYDSPFHGCSSLKVIYVENGTKISEWDSGWAAGHRVYSINLKDPNIENIKRKIENEIDFTIEDGVLKKYNGNESDVIIPYGVTAIGDGVFSGNVDMQSVVIPDSVTSIENSAFKNCTSLETVDIRGGVSHIGDAAFSGCTKLIKISSLKSVNSIGVGAFENCKRLEQINIPSGLIVINNKAFMCCEKLGSIDLPDSLTKIGSNAFYGCDALSKVKIPSKVAEIENSAFGACKNLSAVEICEGVNAIGKMAFAWCEKLERIKLPESLEKIESNAFWGCNSLTEVKIPEKVEEIGDRAFYECKNLSLVEISDGVKIIGERAFSYCVKLSWIWIADSVTTIQRLAFESCHSLTEISIPKNVTWIDVSAFADCYYLEKINISEENTTYKSIEGNVYSKDGKDLILYPCGQKNYKFEIPDGVERILPYAFTQARGLEILYIPHTVKFVSKDAFNKHHNIKFNVQPGTFFYGWESGWNQGYPVFEEGTGTRLIRGSFLKRLF